jgi:hypothetical protein
MIKTTTIWTMTTTTANDNHNGQVGARAPSSVSVSIFTGRLLAAAGE